MVQTNNPTLPQPLIATIVGLKSAMMRTSDPRVLIFDWLAHRELSLVQHVSYIVQFYIELTLNSIFFMYNPFSSSRNISFSKIGNFSYTIFFTLIALLSKNIYTRINCGASSC